MKLALVRPWSDGCAFVSADRSLTEQGHTPIADADIANT